MKLKDNFVGLFRMKDSDELFFKSEYGESVQGNGAVFVQHDAYCVSSGEYFWGGKNTVLERENLRVYPIPYSDVKAAVDKYTSKKPILETHKYCGSDDDFTNKYYCPTCNNLIVCEDTNGYYAGKEEKHCSECGQTLDWSNE